IQITFPDSSVKDFQKGVSPVEIAHSISSQLAREIVAATVNGQAYDVMRPIHENAEIALHKFDSKEGQHAFWHSSAHLLAEALQELYSGIQFGIGPAIEQGFYYDIDSGEHVITEKDLPTIESKMLELARSKSAYVRKEVSKAEAQAFFKEKNEYYKLELINDLEDGTITYYTHGNFTDLCRGPHIPTTEPIKAIKLLNVAGAYWRGDEKNKQLIRIYGISFPKKKLLDEFLEKLELAKQRDHRKIGKELELFMF